MKHSIAKLTSAALFATFILSACSKDDLFEKPMPVPGAPAKPADSAFVRFETIVDFAGQPYHSSNLTAVATIVNDKNTEVAAEKILTLNLSGAAKSESFKLPVGSYSLTKFRLVYGNVHTHFATPVAGSVKAALVQQPLALKFTVSKEGSVIPVEVVRVQAGDRPAAFGYPSGAFDNGQSDANPFMKVKMTAIMQVGRIVYDSLPASLRLTTWQANGEMNTTYLGLKSGITEVSLLKAGVRFKLEVSMWGIQDELTLDRTAVNEDTVYTFRGAKEAKLLKSETTSRLVDGFYKAESKNEYLYDAANRLSKINYYLKRPDNSPYRAMTDVFEYSGAQVQKISRYNEANKVISVTSFTYDAFGKVHTMVQDENEIKTTAAVQYGNVAFPAISIHYQYPGQYNTLDYAMTFYKGNVLKDQAHSSGRSKEEGLYSYDTQINPYAHMNWPNLFLSNTSKNNLTAQYKTYYEANHPAAIPYNFTYSYDGDGYPKELIKQYQPYGETHHWYTTKTVYAY